MENEILVKDIIYCVNSLLQDLKDEKISNLLHRRLIKLLEDLPIWVNIPVPVWKDIDFCVSLISKDWWYHWSHLEFVITPIIDHESGCFSNPQYTISGKGISFSVMLAGYESTPIHEKLCLGIIGAYAKYLLAILRIKEAKAKDTYMHIDTGRGPIMVSPEGVLSSIPWDKCLMLDGSLADRKTNGPGVEIIKHIPEELV